MLNPGLINPEGQLPIRDHTCSYLCSDPGSMTQSSERMCITHSPLLPMCIVHKAESAQQHDVNAGVRSSSPPSTQSCRACPQNSQGDWGVLAVKLFTSDWDLNPHGWDSNPAKTHSTWFQDLMKLRFLMSYRRKISVRGRVAGKE